MTALRPEEVARLRPHQLDLVQRLIAADEPAVFVLEAPTGSGRATAAAAAATALVREGAPVLIVADRSLGEQLATQAAQGDIHQVDDLTRAEARRRSSTIQVDTGLLVTVVTPNALVRPEVAEQVRDKRWALCVIDDPGSSELIGPLLELVSTAPIDRTLVLATNPVTAEQWATALRAEVVRWDLPVLSGGDDSLPPPSLRVEPLAYRRHHEEADLLSRVDSLVAEFASVPGVSDAQLREAGASSAFALQARALKLFHRLREARNAAVHGQLRRGDTLLGQVQLSDPGMLSDLSDELGRLVAAVDELESDPKRDALVSHFAGGGSRGGIVLFVSFPETGRYLLDGLALLGMDVELLTERLMQERVDTLLSSPDGYLIAPDGALPGRDLRSAQVGVNYDLPGSRRSLHLRWTRLGWEGPQAATMVTPVDEGGSSSWESEMLPSLALLP